MPELSSVFIKAWESSFSSEGSAPPLDWLWTNHNHPSYVRQRRAISVYIRLNWLSTLFFFITLAWCVIDILTLPKDLAHSLILIRLVTALLFYGIAKYARQATVNNAPPHTARTLSFAFWLVSMGFFISSLLIIGSYNTGNRIDTFIIRTYLFFPYTILSCIAFFPFTIKESLMISLPVLGLSGLVYALIYHGFPLNTFDGSFFLLFLLGLISTFASFSQLCFMIILIFQSSRDPLTQAMRRNTGLTLGQVLLEQCQREGYPLSVAFLDIDHFKSVNDQWGHIVGDEILQNFSQQILHQLRKTDVFIRWGGEEFVILLPNASEDQTSKALARILGTIDVKRPDQKKVTASVGIATAEPNLPIPFEITPFILEADQWMYHAKQAGRNRLVSYYTQLAPLIKEEKNETTQAPATHNPSTPLPRETP